MGVLAIASAYAGGNMLGPSMKADVIDYDEYRTGQRKEGAYFATWSFVTKGGAAAAIALTGVALELAGFRANEQQTADAAPAIRGVFAGAPCLCYALAAGLILRFRLDARDHAELRAAIAARAERERVRA
jgi:GPH family glycoside/pentoside/hexuronide:cation symporter